MDLFSFTGSVLASEMTCVEFLQHFGVIPYVLFCPGKDGVACGAPMRTVQRLQKSGQRSVRWRCSVKACRTERSVRSASNFLKYERCDGRADCKLTLRQILLLLYLWVCTTSTTRQLRDLTGLGLATIADWTNFFREVCSHSIANLPKLVGTALEPAQLDESRFGGVRKYNRGRLLQGDINLPGPWVFGLCTRSDNVRFYVVPDRTTATLLPIILDQVEPGSHIWSDRWASYNCLISMGFQHATVNHTENFVDPETGVNTQIIERSWKEGKLWLKRVRRPSHLLQSHLDEVAWRMNTKNHPSGLLGAFLEDVAKHYS